MSLRTIAAFNQFLSCTTNNQTVLELSNPNYFNFLKKDYENLVNQTFKWEEIEIPSIQVRSDSIKSFNVAIDDFKITFLNTEPFEKLISLKFLDLITEKPDYTFGQPIYNNSLNYYTYLLHFFINFYLKKDFHLLDKIDAEDIETYSPLSRHYIRQNNRDNDYIRKKYFNEEFNLIKFAIKLVEKFVPGATWRWIGGNHKVHVYCIEICKMIAEYGIATQDECDQMKHALYLKVQIYKSLEAIVNKDSATIAMTWIDVWLNGLISVREYYSEFLINCLYFQQDNEVINILMKINRENKKNPIKHEDQLRNIIKFNKSVLFEEEFGRKTMDFLLNYILSQNQVAKKHVTSRKIEAIADNFLHIFSNVDDPYLHSLKLMRENDYINFIKEETKEFGPMVYIKQDFIIFSNDLKNLMSKISKGDYLYHESDIIKDLEEILDHINSKISFLTANQSNEPRNFINQKLLSSTNIPFIIFNIIGNLMRYSDFLSTNNTTNLLFKFKNLLQYFLKDNLEMQSSFFYQKRFKDLELMFYKYPTILSNLLFDTFHENAQILIAKEYMLDILIDMFKKHYETKKTTIQICDYIDLSKTVDVLALYINLSFFKIFNWIPEYDLRMANDLLSNIEFINAQEFERLLLVYEGDKMKLDDVKLDFLMNFLSLLHIITSYRYTNEVYIKLNENLSIDKLINLISLCNNNLNFRSIFLEVYGNIHIDFKNHLIDKRSDYYFTKPLDMQYEEDPFYDKEYNKTIDLIIKELKFVMEFTNSLKSSDVVNFYAYLNNTIFGNLVKLMNYFLVIKEGDLHKLSKYIPKLEELNDFLFSNRFVILGIYGVTNIEFDSPERKNLEVEMAKVDENFKIKKDKLQILGHCKAIIAMCTGIMNYKPLHDAKKGLVSKKTTVNRIVETYLKTLNFSNKLNIRRENLSLPFDKLLKKKKKKFGGKIQITKNVAAFYEHYKMTKMSVDAKQNIYIATLNQPSLEMQTYNYNLCAFVHNQLATDWNIDQKNKKYTLIESLCNTLFISTNSIQSNLYKVMIEQGENETKFMDKIWIEMKTVMSFVKFKTNIDRFWKEAFRRTMLLIKFHQFICEDNCKEFKNFFRLKILPNDTIDRLQRWTTMFQKMSDSCQWHYNYNKGDINNFERSHRPYLLPLTTGIFENLAELCTGPFPENQLKIYTYIYDRYNGFLKRFFRDADSEFYRAKLTLIEFMLSMLEGMHPDIISYHTTNFELTNLNFVIVNSFKQLYYCLGKKDSFDKKKMSDYSLGLKDYKEMLNYFESNKKFANHTLLNICLKLFGYIKIIGEINSKYNLYCKERDDLLISYERNGKFKEKSITEEDLVTYKFLRSILIKIEIKRSKNDDLVSYHFAVLSKCLYLSEETKKNFLNKVDRSSQGAKISGLLAKIEYFQIEMENNEERFKNYYLLYKIFGAGKTYYFELSCLIICFINNVLLMVDLQLTEEILFDPNYRRTVLALGLIEIGMSLAAIFAYLFLNYSLEKKIAQKEFLQLHADKDYLNSLDLFYVNYWSALLAKKEIFIFLFHIFFVALGLSTTYGLIGIDFFAIIFLFPSMQYIVKSVTEHLNHILSTLLLAAVIMYAYSIFVHLYFKDYFANEEAGNCNNLSHCYFTIVNKAFRNGEGIGGLMEMAFYGEAGGDPRYYGSLFLNISFFLIINTVLLNIILAVLVDTFSELRQRSDDFSEIFFLQIFILEFFNVFELFKLFCIILF